MASALLDIATSFASSEEAVGAIFPNNNSKGKRRDETPGASTSRPPRKRRRDTRGNRRFSRPGSSRPRTARIPEAQGSSTTCLKDPAHTIRAR